MRGKRVKVLRKIYKKYFMDRNYTFRMIKHIWINLGLKEKEKFLKSFPIS